MVAPELLMAEAVALVVIGSVAHIVRNKISDVGIIVDNLVLAVIAGIAGFSMMGEPSAATAIPYMGIGYGLSEFFDWIFKPWWEKD